jgi:hypothetical protein
LDLVKSKKEFAKVDLVVLIVGVGSQSPEMGGAALVLSILGMILEAQS